MVEGTRPDLVVVDELLDTHVDADGAIVMTWPAVPGARGYELRQVPRWVAELDADGRFEINLPVGPSTVTHLPPSKLAAEHTAELLAQWSAAMQPVRDAYAELVEQTRPMLASLADIARSLGHWPVDHEQDPREAVLAAKRAPGRTGPPAARLDGRRARR